MGFFWFFCRIHLGELLLPDQMVFNLSSIYMLSKAHLFNNCRSFFLVIHASYQVVIR